ncbi:MAG: hypothetical protein IKO02_05485 [Lentisphaeria bacterium]|nr:hypothetical protein [Lentisphaeria bacterium]
MKRFLLNIFTVMAAAAVLILTGCRTDYTKNAVERARTYALNNLKGLSDNQRNFIRFTQPEIYENIIYPRYVAPLDAGNSGHIKIDDVRRFPVAPQHDLMHSCVVWNPPDLGARVVVAGEGERSMMFWEPYRVIVKRYDPGDTGLKGATSAASAFVRNNMPYLSTSELNRVRFDNPETVYTRLPVDPEDVDPEKLSSWEEYLNERDGKNAGASASPYTQLSLMWPADDPLQCIVVTGFSKSGTFSGWQLRTAELMDIAKLDGARLTREEIDAIPKTVPARTLVFPGQSDPVRNPFDRPGYDRSPEGGAFIFH